MYAKVDEINELSEFFGIEERVKMDSLDNNELNKLAAHSGPGLFESYKAAKLAHANIDSWLSASVYHEYPIDAEEIITESICNSSELPWEDPEVFIKVGLVLNGREPILDIGQSLDVREIVVAVTRLKVAFPDEHFNDSVASYIAAVCIDEGFAIVPRILSFVQPKIPITNLSSIQQEVLAARLRGLE